jgi:hypothetical protein
MGFIPFVGVGVITFLGIRTYIVQSSWKILQETQDNKDKDKNTDNIGRNMRRFNALEDLVWWKGHWFSLVVK